MIKLIIIARCIPEDVYLRSIEQPAPVLVGEKKFSIVVRDPESWYIGRLAVEIKNRYESIYKRPFGQVKYLKEAEDDCDLDPELSVADLLVDEGKAARDGADQKKIVKVIQEQGRAVRQGSVIPDLTPLHYQPPTRPPVPKFPVAEKRTIEDVNGNGRPSKRRRLGQIEEEGQEDIVSSIEGNGRRSPSHFELPDAHFLSAINGNLDDASIEPKQESPELARTWINTGPATRDELELLPEAPANFHQRGQRTGLPVTSIQNQGPEIRETSAAPADQQNHRTPGASRQREPLADRFARQQSLANAETPITPPFSGNNARTPAGQAVSMLNGMKSASPALRQSASRSANKFRKTKKDIYDFDESDIDDTQMSPRSRALRTKITPKLVATSHSRGSGDASTKSARSRSSRQESGSSNAMEVDSNKENQKEASKQDDGLPRSRYQHQEDAAADSGSPSWQRDGFSKLPPMPAVPAKRPRQGSDTTPAERSSILGSDETWSVQGDGTKTKRKRKSRQSRANRRSSGSLSTSRTSSVASSTRESGTTGASKQQNKEGENEDATETADVQNDDEDEENLDSPGAQLEESLRQSSPTKEKSVDTRVSTRADQSSSQSAFEPVKPTKKKKRSLAQEVDEENDVERPPESVSDSQDAAPPLRTPKRPRTTRKPVSKQQASRQKEELRCFTCWSKPRLCDNKKPKCTSCETSRKSCQVYDMTKAEAQKEKADRKAGISKAPKAAPKPTAKPTSKQPKSRMSEEVVSATDRDEVSEDEGGDETVEPEEEETVVNERPTSPNKEPKDGKSATLDEKGGAARKPASSEKKPKKRKSPSPEEEEEATRAKRISPLKKPRKTKAKAKLSEEGTSAPVGNERLDAQDADKESVMAETTVGAAGTEPVVPVQTAEQPLAVPKDSNANREQSVVSHTSSSILPPGMTQDEYERLVKKREGLTESQRRERNLLAQKIDKQKEKDSTPPVPRSQSSQQSAKKSKKDNVDSAPNDEISTSSKTTSKSSQPPPATQPTRIPASVTSSTPAPKASEQPKSAPPKPSSATSNRETPKTTADKKKNLQQHPKVATTASSVDGKQHQNPPFRQPQQRKSLLSAASTVPSPTISLTNSKSLAQVREALKSRAGSGASTPQPTSTAAKIAALKGNVQKKPFSLSDDEDEESSDSDSGPGEDTADKEEEVVKAAEKVVNGKGSGGVIVRQRTPSETGSGSDDSDDDSEL
ncbi:hypothetical protein PMZ80_004351 [Knufia obscura]|uniref:Zn(2)-C6 fungal-type domain-containing protein n=1 Tax=Knufia obscura TaxID=1635080 RepID=A0ABR0RTF9_9EURO|nr:hypothetical protein PMZ80_004351 [Knufia obscura]